MQNPDLGEHTFWGRFGVWAVGALGLLVLKLWDFMRGELKDLRSALERKADADDVDGLTSKEESARQRADIGKLFEKLDAVKEDMGSVRAEIVDTRAKIREEIAATHVAQLTATSAGIEKMTAELRAAIDEATLERRRQPRSPT